MLLNALAQWCTSWFHQPRFCVQTPFTKPRGIMCLLAIVANVQAPRWEVHQQLVFGSFICGCSSSILNPPDHDNTRLKSSFATATFLQRWQMRDRSKAHDPLYWSAWSAADRPANNVANMAASLAPSNLRWDSKASAIYACRKVLSRPRVSYFRYVAGSCETLRVWPMYRDYK